MPRDRLKDHRLAGARQEILAVARAVLAQDGVGGLTVAGVARELGVSKQALYHYFPSRDALLFEVVLDELTASADAVHAACEAAPDGPGAVEALIRTYVGYFAPRLDAFRLTMVHVQQVDPAALSPERVARIRPINDRLYGVAEARLAAEWGRRAPDPLAARRLVFSAHLAAIGLLSMKAVVEHFRDPLRYGDDVLVDELCRVFRTAAEEGPP